MDNKTSKKFLPGLVAILGLVISGLFVAPAANAATITVGQENWSKSSAKTSAVSAAQASTSKKVGFYFSAKGVSKKNINKAKKAGKTLTVKKGKLKSSHLKKKGVTRIHIHKGVKFINTMKLPNGKSYKFKDYVGSKWSPGPYQILIKRNGKWVKAGNAKGQGNCNNPVYGYTAKVKPTHKSVIMYKSKSDMKYKVKLKVTARGTLKAQATAVCVGSSASATTSASGTATGYVTVTVKAKSASQARAKGSNVRLTAKQTNSIYAKARANARVNLSAKAQAMCKDSTTEVTPPKPPAPKPPTPKPEPPKDNPPQVEIKGSPAHLYAGGNAAIFFEAWDADGDQISVSATGTGAGYLAGTVEVNTRWDGTACPAQRTCYRATAWANSTPGTMNAAVTVTAKGLSQTARAAFPVVADNF